ncbi:hypothetical protein DPMN_093929 [Dreissena polymorpha]|uniref:Uncharacterized protein n=1 Tax=Dreissena polymorpha TaxID=45954 RepID=A0A9D4R2D5_DREPO|nr:hypothetical protein DPMN_093929 [Dreissena polymorpha]
MLKVHIDGSKPGSRFISTIVRPRLNKIIKICPGTRGHFNVSVTMQTVTSGDLA